MDSPTEANRRKTTRCPNLPVISWAGRSHFARSRGIDCKFRRVTVASTATVSGQLRDNASFSRDAAFTNTPTTGDHKLHIR